MTTNDVLNLFRKLFKHEGIITETYSLMGALQGGIAGTTQDQFSIPCKWGQLRLRRIFVNWRFELDASGDVLPIETYTKGSVSVYISRINLVSNTPLTQLFTGAVPANADNGIYLWFCKPGIQVTIEDAVAPDDLMITFQYKKTDAVVTNVLYSIIADVERIPR